MATNTKKMILKMATNTKNIQDGIYDEFVKRAAELAKKRVVGDPWTDVDQGPQVIL